MDTKNIERADGKLKFQVTVDAKRFEEEIQKAYLREKKRIVIPGFRKGKAPRSVIEGMYGKNVFHDEAVDAMALEAFQAGSKEAGDRTAGDPALLDSMVNEDGSVTISFEAALYPEATLGAYKGITAYKAPVVIGDEEIQKELEQVQRRNSRIITVDRGAAKGDTLTIDFDGFRDGKRFDGGKAENYRLVLGSGTFVPGFEDQLIGAVAGEHREVNITFPENYAPELAGADAVFKVKVREVLETQLPELDDEFAKDVSEFETLDEYKESIRKDLQERREKVAENDFRNLLIRKGVKEMTVELPEAMIRRRVNEMVEHMAQRCRAQGMSLQQYLQTMGMNEQIYRTYIRPAAISDLKTEVFLEKVAALENLTVSAEEIDKEYAESAERYEMKVEDLRKSVPEDVIEMDLRMKKAGELILENGIATDVPEKDELAEDESADAETAEEESAGAETAETERAEADPAEAESAPEAPAAEAD